jgi:hypothetical protein
LDLNNLGLYLNKTVIVIIIKIYDLERSMYTFSVVNKQSPFYQVAVQKNRVHFKNQAIKFSSIFCFVNVDFDIVFVNRL